MRFVDYLCLATMHNWLMSMQHAQVTVYSQSVRILIVRTSQSTAREFASRQLFHSENSESRHTHTHTHTHTQGYLLPREKQVRTLMKPCCLLAMTLAHAHTHAHTHTHTHTYTHMHVHTHTYREEVEVEEQRIGREQVDLKTGT